MSTPTSKKATIILISFLLAIAGVMWAKQKSKKVNSTYVIISAFGQEYGKYNLQKDEVIEFINGKDKNIIEIKNGSIEVIYSNCENQICVNEYPISADYPGVICCLPHGLIIELEE